MHTILQNTQLENQRKVIDILGWVTSTVLQIIYLIRCSHYIRIIFLRGLLKQLPISNKLITGVVHYMWWHIFLSIHLSTNIFLLEEKQRDIKKSSNLLEYSFGRLKCKVKMLSIWPPLTITGHNKDIEHFIN